MSLDIKSEHGVEIFLGYHCNYRCTFCFENKIRDDFLYAKKETVRQQILDGRKKGNTYIIFSGGEPTLDLNLVEYISYSREVGYEKIIIHTNGTGFSSEKLCSRYYNLGVTGIIISIHGYGEISNVITKNSKSFDLLHKTLFFTSKLREKDSSFTIDTNTVLCKYNQSSLYILFKYLNNFPIIKRQITYPYSMSDFYFPLKEIQENLPDLEKGLKQLEKVLDFCIEQSMKDIVLEAFPYCFIKPRHRKFIEKNFRSVKDVIPSGEIVDTSTSHYTNGKSKIESCKGCEKYNVCYGFSDDFLICNPNYIAQKIIS